MNEADITILFVQCAIDLVYDRAKATTVKV